MSLLKKIFSQNRKSYRKQLFDYYEQNNYDIIPEIPSEEESKRILENYKLFPSVLVAKQYMERLDNGLLKGDIILLWWLDNPRTKKETIPQYFLYEYGVNAQKNLLELEKQGYINSDIQLTKLGKELLNTCQQMVREHKAVKTYHSNGEVTYTFSDKKVAKDMRVFKSSGDEVKDQFIGKAFERNKDYDNAIKAYLSAYKLALRSDLFKESPPPNIFNRLAIIYRKQQKYNDEINIIKEALKYYPNHPAFGKRLKRAKELAEN